MRSHKSCVLVLAPEGEGFEHYVPLCFSRFLATVEFDKLRPDSSWLCKLIVLQHADAMAVTTQHTDTPIPHPPGCAIGCGIGCGVGWGVGCVNDATRRRCGCQTVHSVWRGVGTACGPCRRMCAKPYASSTSFHVDSCFGACLLAPRSILPPEFLRAIDPLVWSP